MSSDLARSLADAWNVSPQKFSSQRAAQRAIWFYERELRMPVEFWIRRADEIES